MSNFEEVIRESFASIEKDDLRILLPIVASIQPQKIVEIGTWKGYSANVWVEAFQPKDFITIEKDSAESLFPMRIPSKIYHQMWFDTDSHDPKVLETLKIYMPEIDFLFVDGAHDYKGVSTDWKMYGPLVKRGGIVAFHDVCYHADKTEEVDILWKELRKQYPYVEIKVGKNSTGIGVMWV